MNSTTTSTAATKSGISIKSRVKAGGITGTNHNQAVKGLCIKSGVRAGIKLSDILVSSY